MNLTIFAVQVACVAASVIIPAQPPPPPMKFISISHPHFIQSYEASLRKRLAHCGHKRGPDHGHIPIPDPKRHEPYKLSRGWPKDEPAQFSDPDKENNPGQFQPQLHGFVSYPFGFPASDPSTRSMFPSELPFGGHLQQGAGTSSNDMQPRSPSKARRTILSTAQALSGAFQPKLPFQSPEKHAPRRSQDSRFLMRRQPNVFNRPRTPFPWMKPVPETSAPPAPRHSSNQPGLLIFTALCNDNLLNPMNTKVQTQNRNMSDDV